VAHTLQLAILDALQNAWEEVGVEPYINDIKEGRELVKKLRTQNNLLLLKGKARPPLDVKTRYLSPWTIQ